MGEHLPKYADELKLALGELPSPVVSVPPILSAKDPARAVINGCFVAAKRHAQPA
jgi:hypothetical protein